MSLADIRDGIANALTASGFRATGYVPAQLNPPCLVVSWPLDYSVTDVFGDAVQYQIPVVAYISMADARAADAELMAWMEPDGLPAAIDANPTLNGACQHAIVTTVENFGTVAVDGSEHRYLTATFMVDVLA